VASLALLFAADGCSPWMAARRGWLLAVDGCSLWMAARCGWLLAEAANAEYCNGC
jgi:hypothetical protein